MARSESRKAACHPARRGRRHGHRAGARVGPDYVSSDNLELLSRDKLVGDGVGDTLFVTSTLSLTVYDIAKPETPRRIGLFTLDVEFENEEVPTNGKILGISGQIGCPDPTRSTDRRREATPRTA